MNSPQTLPLFLGFTETNKQNLTPHITQKGKQEKKRKKDKKKVGSQKYQTLSRDSHGAERDREIRDRLLQRFPWYVVYITVFQMLPPSNYDFF